MDNNQIAAFNALCGLSGDNAIRAPVAAIAAAANQAAVPAVAQRTLLEIRNAIVAVDYERNENAEAYQLRVNFGIACNQGVFDLAVAEQMIFKRLVIQSANIGVFSGDVLTPNVFVMAQLLSAARMFNAGAGSATMKPAEFKASYQAMAMAELLGPYIPAEWQDTEGNTRLAIIRAVTTLMTLGEDVSAELPPFNEWYHELLGVGPLNAGEAIRNMTINQAMVVLEAMAVKTEVRLSWMNRQSCIANMILSASKRGNLTQDLATKVITGCRTEMSGLVVTVNIMACEKFYSRYCRYITETNAAPLFRRLLTLLPESLTTLRNVVIRSAGNGMTTYLMIIRAMKEYPDFPWAVARSIAAGEFVNLEIAMRTIGNNAYFGYSQNIGAAAASKFKCLGYLSIQLCIEVGCDGPLSNYLGKPESVPRTNEATSASKAFHS